MKIITKLLHLKSHHIVSYCHHNTSKRCTSSSSFLSSYSLALFLNTSYSQTETGRVCHHPHFGHSFFRLLFFCITSNHTHTNTHTNKCMLRAQPSSCTLLSSIAILLFCEEKNILSVICSACAMSCALQLREMYRSHLTKKKKNKQT